MSYQGNWLASLLTLALMAGGLACSDGTDEATQGPTGSERQATESPTAPLDQEATPGAPDTSTETAGAPTASVESGTEASPTEPLVAASDRLRTKYFRTPSGNIECDGTFGVACFIGDGLNPQPPRPEWCDIEWGVGLEMDRRGADVICTGNPPGWVAEGIDGPRVVLEYGREWTRNGVTCRSRETGLTCENRRGLGFFLSRARWELFGNAPAN